MGTMCFSVFGRFMRSVAIRAAFAVVLISLAFGSVAVNAQTVEPLSNSTSTWSPPRTVYITQTGQSIDGVFLDYWRANNGIASFGYPVTPEFTMTNGIIAQMYAYARFEYWPGAADGRVVKIGNIGEDLRPKNLMRNSIASVDNASANTEVALIARAWLPLSGQDTSSNSDSYVYVEATKHSVSNGFKSFWEATGGDGWLGNPLSQEYVLKGVTYQVFERGQLSWTADNGVSVVPLGAILAQQYQISTAPIAQGNLPAYSEDLFVEPKKEPKKGSGGERWIEVNLTTQYFIAWEGDVSVYETYTSTGRPGFDTPAGTYYINAKLESQTMEGVLGGEYYNVPDVPWVQYFTNRGHAIHGAYWHNNFGTVMSHGCVNLPVEFAAWLYTWTSIGTRVEIHF